MFTGLRAAGVRNVDRCDQQFAGRRLCAQVAGQRHRLHGVRVNVAEPQPFFVPARAFAKVDAPSENTCCSSHDLPCRIDTNAEQHADVLLRLPARLEVYKSILLRLWLLAEGRRRV